MKHPHYGDVHFDLMYGSWTLPGWIEPSSQIEPALPVDEDAASLFEGPWGFLIVSVVIMIATMLAIYLFIGA